MSVVEPGSVNVAPKPMTPFQEFWHYFKRNKGAVIGLVYIIIVLLCAIFADVLA
ncbi:dipeptide ABC transporter permease DppC, partial [Pantoea graminicola]